MAELKDLTIESFAALTASDAPAPGGGSVSAVAGVLGAALSEMVANLTIGKAKYAEVEDEMKVLAQKAAELRERLLEDVQKDTEAFNLYMEALGMPKDTEEQKAARREAMQNGLKVAAQVPLGAAKTAAEIFRIAEAVVQKGNKNAVTDGMVSAMLARTAVLGALLNVKINLGSIKDEAFVAEMQAEVDALTELAAVSEKKILELGKL